MNHEELEERKKLFFKTIKTKNWFSVISNIAIGFIFVGYFV